MDKDKLQKLNRIKYNYKILHTHTYVHTVIKAARRGGGVFNITRYSVFGLFVLIMVLDSYHINSMVHIQLLWF
jgi:hypothetical protein